MAEQHEHQRHKPATLLDRPRELIVACPPLRSGVNLARIIRAAGCCGITRVLACGNAKLDPKITRDALAVVDVVRHRSLLGPLRKLQSDGYPLIGLEQSVDSVCLYEYEFPRRAVLVVGHERHGIEDDVLRLLDAVVEIPVFGSPLSYNAATATAMVLYEYCRQFPRG